MKCVCINSRAISLISLFQGCKDVEDKLWELVLWLAKLKGSVAKTGAHANGKEAERRDQLARFLSHPFRLADKTEISTLVH